MVSAKDIIIKPIKSNIAREFIKKNHYSGKIVNNSNLHFGCFLNDKLGGVLQFGSSLDKRKTQGLVKNTGWNEFIELNRMAFSDMLPRNSESRCIAICIRLIKKHYPHIKWIISFADGTQCGDGTIYRASGFKLTGVKKQGESYTLPNGESFTAITIKLHGYSGGITKFCNKKDFDKIIGAKFGSLKTIQKLMDFIGAKFNEGYQLRYIYLIDKTKEKDLAVPILPFSKIDEMNAGMYKGERISIKDRRTKKED